jgi:membrane protease YdiL (CAAX protease family)
MVDDRDVTCDGEAPDQMSGEPPGGLGHSPVPEPSFGAWRAVKILLAFVGVQVVVGIVGAVPLFLKHGAGAHAAPSPGVAVPPAVLVGVLVAGLVGTVLASLAVLALVRRAFGRPGGEAVRAAVAWRPAPLGAGMRWALAGLAIAAAYVVLGAVAGIRSENPGLLAQAAATPGAARVLWAVLALAVAPPSEELLFRGVLYGGLARSWGAAAAAVTTTVLFVGLHGSEIGRFWPGWVVIGALGVLALRARVVTGSLVPAIALHVGYNLGLVLVAFAVR